MNIVIYIWWALFFMALGGAIVWAFDRYAWRKYYEGKKEAAKQQADERRVRV